MYSTCFLLHEDNPELPGNEAAGIPPSGVSCFAYSPELRELVPQYFPHFQFRPHSKPLLPVVFLAVMGSAGTLAFTGESDIDFWVGVDTARLPDDALEMLQEKLRILETWAFRTAGLEVHFFIADLEKIRLDDYGELSGESCGSALGKLLKDEFYRTALFLEGKVPFYWVMPVGIDDTDYAENIQRLSQDRTFPHQYYLDLGNVGTIRARRNISGPPSGRCSRASMHRLKQC
jgi:adenylate cyclase class 1